MSKCVKCNKVYHPDYIVYQEIRGDMVKVCAFCRLGRNELTIEGENGKVIEVVKKDQASKAYEQFLKDLIKKPNIAKIVQENQIK